MSDLGRARNRGLDRGAEWSPGASEKAGAGVQQRVFVAHMQSSDLGERRDAARPWG